MKILDEEIPLLKNLTKSLLVYRWYWLVFIASIVLDIISTLSFMSEEGIEREANRIIRFLASYFGIFIGVSLGKFLQVITAMAFSALSFTYSRAILMVLIGLNILAGLHNFSIF